MTLFINSYVNDVFLLYVHDNNHHYLHHQRCPIHQTCVVYYIYNNL